MTQLVWRKKRNLSTISMLCNRYSGFPPLHSASRGRVLAFYGIAPCLTVKSVDETLVCDHENETEPLSSTVLSCGAVYHAVNEGYWPRGRSRWLDIRQLLFCVFMDRNGVQVHKLAKKGTRPISSHLDRTWLVNKRLLYGFWGNFSSRTQRALPSEQDSSFLPARSGS